MSFHDKNNKEPPTAERITTIPPSAVHYVNASASATPVATATPVLDVESAHASRPEQYSNFEYTRSYYDIIEDRRRQLNAQVNENSTSGRFQSRDVNRDQRELEQRSQEALARDYAYPENRAAEHAAEPSLERRFKWPENDKLPGIIVAGFFNVGIAVVLLYYFFTMIVFDADGNVKPFKAACFDFEDMTDNMCFFSAGQISFGLISFGQVNIGAVCIGQVSIGVLFALGQVACSVVLAPLGQLCTGWYVHMCQLGFGMYKVKMAQFGIQFLKCFFPSDGEDTPSPCVSC